jgi:hypothetical protein
MQSKTIHDYIWFGLSWRFLQDVVPGAQIHGDACVIANIDKVIHGLQDFGLLVTERAAFDLIALKT